MVFDQRYAGKENLVIKKAPQVVEGLCKWSGIFQQLIDRRCYSKIQAENFRQVRIWPMIGTF